MIIIMRERDYWASETVGEIKKSWREETNEKERRVSCM